MSNRSRFLSWFAGRFRREFQGICDEECDLEACWEEACKNRECEEGYLAVSAASTFCSTPTSTLYRARQAGELPSYKVGKQTLFRRSDLVAWVRRHRE